MGFFDDVSRRVKHKAVEWDVQGKAEKVAAELDKVAHDAKDKAAELADDNRGKIRENLDKAGAKIDERTEGKYADKVAKAKDTVAGGVDKLAEQRPGGPTPPGATPPGATPPGSAAGGGYASGASGASAGGTPAGTYTPEPYRPEPIDLPEPIDEPRRRHRLAPGPAPAALIPAGWPRDERDRARAVGIPTVTTRSRSPDPAWSSMWDDLGSMPTCPPSVCCRPRTRRTSST